MLYETNFKKKSKLTQYVQTTKKVKLLDLYKANHSFNTTIHYYVPRMKVHNFSPLPKRILEH